MTEDQAEGVPASTSEKWKAGEPFRYPMPKGDGKHWERLLEPAMDAVKIRCAAWKDEIQNLLIFAGLFSGVLSAFLVQSYESLQPDPNDAIIALLGQISTRLDNPISTSNLSASLQPSSDLPFSPSSSSIRVNTLWFSSLILSLTTVLIGIVSMQWLAEYQNYPSSLSAKNKLALWHMRQDGLKKWYVAEILAAVPLLLQTALILFFVGLVDFVWSLNHIVAASVIIFITIPLTFIALTTTLPTLQGFSVSLPIWERSRTVPAQCPFKSTQSLVFRRCVTYSRHFFYACVHIFSWFRYVTSLEIFRHGADSPYKVEDPMSQWPHKVTVLEVWSNPSWLSFDNAYIGLCDTYAYNIVIQQPWMDYRSLASFRHTGPIFHTMRGIKTSFSSYLKAGRGLEEVVAGYQSINEILGNVSRVSRPRATLMVQRISFSANDLTSDLGWLSYLSPYTSAPAAQIFEEILLEFLDSCRRVPQDALAHQEELYIRLSNFLCQPNTDFIIEKSGCVRAFYSWINPNHDIHKLEYLPEQFSSTIESFFSSLLDTSKSQELLVNVFHTNTNTDFMRYAIYRQTHDKVDTIVQLISQGIEEYLNGSRKIGVLSDLLLYSASHYTFWTFRSDRSCQRARDLRQSLRSYWLIRADASKVSPERFTDDRDAPWWWFQEFLDEEPGIKVEATYEEASVTMRNGMCTSPAIQDGTCASVCGRSRVTTKRVAIDVLDN